MQVSVFRPDELSEGKLAEWRRLQRLDPLLESPYICPEFIRIVAKVRPRVVVAVAEECGAAVAFLPMQIRGSVAGPVGCPLSDCQAIIAAREWAGDPRALVSAAGVSAYEFNHQRMQQHLLPYCRAVRSSPVIDLSRGFDAYVNEMWERGRNSRETSSGRPHQIIRKTRWIERKVGRLHFTMHELDERALATLITWKRQQYRENGRILFARSMDVFASDWVVELLRCICTTRSEEFAGLLSSLRLDDQIVALHMGMRSHNVLHWWFPAYDKRYAKLSPGLILLLEICRSAAAIGIREIELGPGTEVYKRLVANTEVMVSAGFLGFPSLPVWMRNFKYEVDTLARRLPIGQLGTWPGRLFKRSNNRKWLRA